MRRAYQSVAIEWRFIGFCFTTSSRDGHRNLRASHGFSFFVIFTLYTWHETPRVSSVVPFVTFSRGNSRTTRSGRERLSQEAGATTITQISGRKESLASRFSPLWRRNTTEDRARPPFALSLPIHRRRERETTRLRRGEKGGERKKEEEEEAHPRWCAR